MNDLSQYQVVRNQIRAGDLIAFRGTDPLCGWIELSDEPTHVGMVRVIDRGATGRSVVRMVEATVEGELNGVQTSRLSERLANYDESGCAWWLPLADEVRAAVDWLKFYRFIDGAEDHVRYDKGDLFEFILHDLPTLGPPMDEAENRKQTVSSGFVAAVLEAAEVLRGLNWSQATPQDLIEMKLYSQYVQILGNPEELHNFNSL